MGKILSVREIIWTIKDKVSQSKATLISNPKSLSLQLSLLRATTHDSFTPPSQKHLSTILSFGDGSRATASAAIEAIMDRLQTTGNACVAVKCLITVHHIAQYGSFILQDQLSVYPANGGRNHLKLSSFRDTSSPVTWELSSWVRWYALYLEHLLSTCRGLGFFFSSTSSTAEKHKESEKLVCLTNSDLLNEIDTLITLLEEACKRPNSSQTGNNLIENITELVEEDYLSVIHEVSIRITEFKERLKFIKFADSVELGCALKRLEGCKEKLVRWTFRKRMVVHNFWGLISQMRDKLRSDQKFNKDDGKMRVFIRRIDKVCGSARFRDGVGKLGDSVRFSSGRYAGSDKFSATVFESIVSRKNISMLDDVNENEYLI